MSGVGRVGAGRILGVVVRLGCGVGRVGGEYGGLV